MASAIAAVEGALEALANAKGGMDGKTDKNAFLQVQKAATLAVALVQADSKTALSQKRMSILEKLAQPGSGEADQYSFHSNDIISLLEDLKDKFTANKNELDQAEFESKAEFDSKIVDLENEKQFDEKDKAEKEALQQKKTDEEAKAKEDRMQEQADYDADSAFLVTLTADCEQKAKTFDQRSTTRSGELTAISEAMGALKEGVKPNYGANKKLSFLQLGSGRNSATEVQKARSVRKVAEFLIQKARKFHSGILSTAALRIETSEDHFVKVRTLIKDLLAKLKDDAEKEAEQKSFCDKAMKAAVSKRDANQAGVEASTAKLAELDAEDKQLQQEIADLSAGIAANQKAKKEATELREKEKAENEQTVEESEAGKKAVEFALSTLKEFYGGNAGNFMQVAPRNAAANMDRSGKTVADLAPEVADSNYKGSQAASGGIIGLLEVILSDFDRTIETVSNDEEAAATEYDSFVSETDADTTAKEKSTDTKKARRVEIEEEITIQTDLQTEAEGDLKDANDELSVLHTSCVAGEETYADRVEARNKEIEALKEAHSILEDWQSF